MNFFDQVNSVFDLGDAVKTRSIAVLILLALCVVSATIYVIVKYH